MIRRLLVLLGAIGLGACSPEAPAQAEGTATVSPPAASEPVTIRFAAFTTVREAYEKRIIPLFVEQCRRRSGVEVRFEQSYGASGAQAEAIAAGYEADVAALSNEEDVEDLVASGLVPADWRETGMGGIVSRSVVVFAVRPGNPQGLEDWPDLSRAGLRIVMPDPATSGGARWGIAAIYGAALRADPKVEPEPFLARILERVVLWSPDARSSFQEFVSGVGDVALTSESEVMRSRMFGHEIDWVVPKSTLRMDNPAVVVASNADRHGVREIAAAFVEFLRTEEAQRAFSLRGFRPVSVVHDGDEPEPERREEELWGVEDLGGWSKLREELFGNGAVFDRARKASRED